MGMVKLEKSDERVDASVVRKFKSINSRWFGVKKENTGKGKGENTIKRESTISLVDDETDGIPNCMV